MGCGSFSTVAASGVTMGGNGVISGYCGVGRAGAGRRALGGGGVTALAAALAGRRSTAW